MSISSLDETVAAIGYAKVIVSLKNNSAATEGLAAASEGSLEDHFMIPSEAQAENLAMSATALASRKFKRSEPLTSRRVRVYPHLGLAVGFADATGVASLEADPKVTKVEKAPELSLIRPVEVRSAKLGVGPTWGIKRLKVDKLWAAGVTGKGVLVGHLDTGVDGTHPALAGAIAKFAEFDMAGDQVPNAQPRDSAEHGTHTAGTIAGRAGLKGSFGVAPDARLVSGMVIEGGQVIDRILAGLDWMIGEGAHILSMSLGLRGFTPAFQTVIDSLRAANVLPVIAVGNEGPNTSRSPGNYANVLSVGAMDSNDQVADFSGSQQFDRPVNPLCPALVAPGVDILSCVPNGQFKTMDGSSMATPHIAGLAALLLQARPAATADQVEQAIVSSCSLPAGMAPARGNHGIPDATVAFQLLTGAQLPVAAAVTLPRRMAKPGRKERMPVRRGATRTPKKTAHRTKVAASKRGKSGPGRKPGSGRKRGAR
jgi:subtilisin